MKNYRLIKILLAFTGVSISACSSVSSSPESAAVNAAPTQNGDYMPAVDTTKNMTPAEGFAELRVQPVPDPTREVFTPSDFSHTGGDFRIHCAPSHMANDDFIVYPNQEGAAHHHTFFGNTGAYFNATSETIRNSGNSTCQGGIANRSAYWIPSLIDTKDGTPLIPDYALFYYKGGDVKPPNGLMMIAGDHTATADKPQSWDKINWQCNAGILGGVAHKRRKNYIPDCVGDLTAIVHFPTCWDGKNLDSPSHKAHMAYDIRGRCPATHPKALPHISGIIHYKVNGTENLRIASDNYKGGRGGYSLHMDYVFGWSQQVLDTWWDNCNVPDKDCHADLLGDGTWLY